MRFLITGGAGFIGQHLARRLLAGSDEVRILDDGSTGDLSRCPREAVAIRGDVRDPDLLRQAASGVECIFHLAAAVGPALVASDPMGTWSRNVEGTARVVDRALAEGSRLVVVSSSEVYGSRLPEGGPLRESDPARIHPTARRDLYGLSKAAGEALALAAHRRHLLPVTIARLFNVVGPGQSARHGMVLARFAASVRGGKPLEVYGDGSQCRCFLHVADAVEALVLLARTPASEGQVVNVGGEEEISILELARLVLRRSGRNLPIIHVPVERVYGEGFTDPCWRRPDLQRLRSLTGWRPRRTLLDAIDACTESSVAGPVRG